MDGLPEDLYEYRLFTCDYAERGNTNYVNVKSFDDRESALVYASEILGLKRRHELYEFEITKQLNESKILKLHKLESEFLQYKTEKLDLINNIKIVSSGKHPVLESKTISELMRIYYGAIGSQCPRCESELQTPIFNTIYRNNAS